MTDAVQVVRITPGDRRQADPTPGKVREQAIAIDGLWSGLVRTEPGATSAWHHHGEHDTSVYVVEGTVRVEFGPGGGEAVDAESGDFLLIPRHVVHRESNTGAFASQEIVTRAGNGPVTINVDGPEPPAS